MESILHSRPILPSVVRYKGPNSKSLPKKRQRQRRRPEHVCEVVRVPSSSLMIESIVPVIQ